MIIIIIIIDIIMIMIILMIPMITLEPPAHSADIVLFFFSLSLSPSLSLSRSLSLSLSLSLPLSPPLSFFVCIVASCLSPLSCFDFRALPRHDPRIVFLLLPFMSCPCLLIPCMISSSCLLPFLSIPPSFPWHFLGMSTSFSMYVPFIASHFPTSPFVSFGFLVLCFPFIPSSLPLFSVLSPLFPFQFPFVSLSFPLAFLSFPRPVPCMSLHFPLFPPLHFPSLPGMFLKKHVFSYVFAKRRYNTGFFRYQTQPPPPKLSSILS